MSLCWPDVSPLPHKVLIICTSRSWETPLEKTHGTNSDRVHPIVLIFLSCIRSQRLQLLHWDTCFFPHILSGCEKKKATKEIAVPRSSAGCLHMLCKRFTAKGRVVEGPRRHGARLWTASRPSSTSAKAHGVPTLFNSWQIQNRISFTISELYTLARRHDFFLFLQWKIFPPPGSVSVRHAVTVWAQSVSDLVPDLLVHLKKKQKKGEKKGNPFLSGQIWKARCPLWRTALLVCSHIKGRCLHSETRGTEGSATLSSWNLIKPVEDRGGWLQNGMTHSGQLLFIYLFK